MTKNNEVKKTVCPITKATFLEKGPSATLLVRFADGKERELAVVSPREFSTGSFGWNVNAKTVADVGGTQVTVQVGANLTVVGSKEAATAAAPAKAAKKGGK